MVHDVVEIGKVFGAVQQVNVSIGAKEHQCVWHLVGGNWHNLRSDSLVIAPLSKSRLNANDISKRNWIFCDSLKMLEKKE